jgi:hypothetical protein
VARAMQEGPLRRARRPREGAPVSRRRGSWYHPRGGGLLDPRTRLGCVVSFVACAQVLPPEWETVADLRVFQATAEDWERLLGWRADNVEPDTHRQFQSVTFRVRQRGAAAER